MISTYQEDDENFVYLPDYIWIDDEQPFYIDENGLSLCFSGYELGISSFEIFEIKISYNEAIEYLSDYFINRIL